MLTLLNILKVIAGLIIPWLSSQNTGERDAELERRLDLAEKEAGAARDALAVTMRDPKCRADLLSSMKDGTL